MKSSNLPLRCGATSSGENRKMSEPIDFKLYLLVEFFILQGGIAYGKKQNNQRNQRQN
jgi:hypothetical protein